MVVNSTATAGKQQSKIYMRTKYISNYWEVRPDDDFLPGKDNRTGQKTNIAEGFRFVNRLCRKNIVIAKNPIFYYNLGMGATGFDGSIEAWAAYRVPSAR